VWVVSGVNGENRIHTEGATSADAWQAAVEQARSLGMFRRRPAVEDDGNPPDDAIECRQPQS
jgi:hypothetical protein